ncbi:MAG: ATP-binding cassette domain-containing protein [Polyangiaceae bacterium]
MIELVGLTKIFPSPGSDDVVAVDDVSLTVPTGKVLCLIGTSGCGKTTTMKMVNRLIEPTRGAVLLDGDDVRERDVIALRRSVGYVIQKGGLFPHMTIADNIGLLCEIVGWDLDRRRRRVAELLELVNLPVADFGDRFPAELSGGQRQRVGVARALAVDPPYILMDEPFGALDPITRAQLHEEFKELQRTVAKTIVLVTHDMAEAFELGDEVALMDEGRIVQIGSEEDFRDRPANDFVKSFLMSHLGDADAS